MCIKSIIYLMPVIFSASIIQSAHASEAVFDPRNSALFESANPSNNSLMMESVVKPNNPNPGSSATAGQLNPSTIIEQSVENQVSAQINNEIFNTSNASGSFNLGGGSGISYVRAGGNVVITFTDPVNGNTTITLPDL